jgi:acetoin utilization protein AcuB
MGMEKLAGDWMSKHLITVEVGDSLLKCYQVMQERGIRHLPVTDGRGSIIGILSDRDLQRAMVRVSSGPELIRDDSSYVFEEGKTAQDFMSWPVQTVEDDTPIQRVASRMLKEKVSAFLVKNGHGQIHGILTTDDLLRLLISLLGRTPGGLVLSLRSVMDEFGTA